MDLSKKVAWYVRSHKYLLLPGAYLGAVLHWGSPFTILRHGTRLSTAILRYISMQP